MKLPVFSRDKKIDLLAPELLFPIAALAFLALSLLSSKVYTYYNVGPLAIILSVVSILLFIAGAVFAKELEINETHLLAVLILLLAPYLLSNPEYIVPAGIGLLLMYLIKKRPERLAVPMLISGLGLFLFFLHTSGIPLLEQSLRASGYTSFWMISFSLFLMGLNIAIYNLGKKEFFLLTLLGLAVFLFGGYRGALMLIAASAMIAGHYRGFLDLKTLAGVLLVSIGLVALAGAQSSSLDLDPARLLLNRAGFTSSIADKIIGSEPLGVQLWLEKRPKFTIGEMYVGHPKSINAGLFGSLWITGGYFSLMFGMFFLGIASGYLYRKRPGFPAAYGLGIACLLLSIEAGLDMVFVLSLTGLMYLCAGKMRDTKPSPLNRQA